MSEINPIYLEIKKASVKADVTLQKTPYLWYKTGTPTAYL